MDNRLKVLVLAQYFSPDMGGGSTRASNVVKGLIGQKCEVKGCGVTVVAAFPHYPYGKVPLQYRRRAIVSESFGAARVFRVWVPALPHSSVINRVILHFLFCVSSLFALPFVGEVDYVQRNFSIQNFGQKISETFRTVRMFNQNKFRYARDIY